MSTDIQKWADRAMYEAVPTSEDGEEVRPTVTLLFMTPDPLGAIAAASEMYRGNPVHSYEDVTEEQRTFFWEDIKKTRLNSPYEFVDFHFLFEGVTRAFTHQLVRQRIGAVYVQESQRFAVKANGAHEVALPPSLRALKEDDPKRVIWRDMVWELSQSYMALVNAGVPAEDARGLLPTNITTRIHYKVNLRALLEHSGNRLCTQAQREWRDVWIGIVDEIRGTHIDARGLDGYAHSSEADGQERVWRAAEVADLFRPICYQTGRCQFQSDMDRACSIRPRVDAFAAAGVPSSEWGYDRLSDSLAANGEVTGIVSIPRIRNEEWLLDANAARLKPGEKFDISGNRVPQ